MSYNDPTKVKRYCVRLSNAEFISLQHVINENNIPDVSKAIRYCIEQEATRLKADHTARVNSEGGTNE